MLRIIALPNSYAVTGLQKLRPHRLNENTKVERERPILDVLQVEIDAGFGESGVYRAAAETSRLR